MHGYELTTSNASSTVTTSLGVDQIDSDGANGGTGIVYGLDLFPRIAVDPLSSGENNHSLDLGLRLAPRVALGDYVWIDEDSDGVQDAGEPPVAGMTVKLLYPDGTAVKDAQGNALVTTTDSNGRYFFDDLAPWEYKVQFVTPSGLWPTTPLAGGAADDSNPVRATGITATFLVPDQATGDTVVDTDPNTVAQFVNPTIDAGFVRLVAMGNYVWVDDDRDGVQDAGESPLSGVLVELFQADGVTPATRANGTTATATTSATGEYVIDGLLEGTYVAKFTPPAKYLFTSQGGGDSSTDSNPDPSTSKTAPFTLVAAATGAMESISNPSVNAQFIDRTIDAGVLPMVGFGDVVWIDSDGQGDQDQGEPPLEGVVVHVLDASGDPVLDNSGLPITATTDADGKYFVDGLAPGDYKARFELLPGYRLTTARSTTSGIDSNPDTSTGVTPTFSIAYAVSGETVASTNSSVVARFVNPTIDAGVDPVTGFGDRVWIDANADGVQNAGEESLSGVTVHLLDANGDPVLNGNNQPVTQITDSRGNYFFGDLAPRSYRARFELPSDYVFSPAGNGTDATGSDADVVTGMTPVVVVTSGPVRSVDAGVVPLVGVGDFVWIDADANGIQDAGEEALPGVTVRLLDAAGDPVLDADGRAVTTVTDANGLYFFDALLPGDYCMKFDLPEFYRFTSQATGSSSNDSNPDTATGITPVFSISGGVLGDTIASSTVGRRARFVNPTIDAGVVDTRVPPSPLGPSDSGSSASGAPTTVAPSAVVTTPDVVNDGVVSGNVSTSSKKPAKGDGAKGNGRSDLPTTGQQTSRSVALGLMIVLVGGLVAAVATTRSSRRNSET